MGVMGWTVRPYSQQSTRLQQRRKNRKTLIEHPVPFGQHRNDQTFYEAQQEAEDDLDRSSVERLPNNSLLWRSSRNSCKMIRKTFHQILCGKVSKALPTSFTLSERNGFCCGMWSRSVGDVSLCDACGLASGLLGGDCSLRWQEGTPSGWWLLGSSGCKSAGSHVQKRCLHRRALVLGSAGLQIELEQEIRKAQESSLRQELQHNSLKREAQAAKDKRKPKLQRTASMTFFMANH